jgi:hypothetical protein
MNVAMANPPLHVLRDYDGHVVGRDANDPSFAIPMWVSSTRTFIMFCTSFIMLCYNPQSCSTKITLRPLDRPITQLA